MREAYCPKSEKKEEYIVKVDKVTRNVKDIPYTLPVKVAYCKSCNEEVFVMSIEEEVQQVFFDAYRADHDLPTIEEIIQTRKKLDLTQRDFSRLLGFGEITISRYELGSLPSATNAQTILSANDTYNLERYFEQNKSKLSESGQSSVMNYLNIHNNQINKGNTSWSIEKFHQLVALFVKKTQVEDSKPVYLTKLNKLLYYTDFNAFNKLGKSITGSKYVKLSFGPVPNNAEWKYDQNPYVSFEKDEENRTSITYQKDPLNTSLSEEEIQIAEAIYSHFKYFNTNEISEASHKESGWLNTEDFGFISYYYAKDLAIQV